jgi:multidrug efflux system membrane fusion protein
MSQVISRPRSRRRLVYWSLAAVVLAVLAAAVVSRVQHPPLAAVRAAAEPVPVRVTRVGRQDVPIYLDGLGTVQAYRSVTVHSMIDGNLTEVAFREGQDVHAGDLLARIDARPYQASLDQALAKKAQDEANLANARVDLARYAKLAATAYTSAQTADTQKALVAVDEALVRGDQASIDSARTQLSYTTITAPISGRLGIRQVDAGNIVHAADSTGIVVITTLQPISVLFTLPQQSLPAVAAAMKAGHPEVVALAQGDAAGDKPLDRGTLEVLDNAVDPTTGTIKLKATFPNPDLVLWPGGFVNTRLLVQTERAVLTVPPVAVQRGPDGPYLYILQPDNTVLRRPVTTGHEDLNAAIITKGLNEGETVVVEGSSRLSDHQQVSVTQAPP